MHSRTEAERKQLLVGFSSSMLAHVIGLGLWLLLATTLIGLNQDLVQKLAKAREAARQRAEQQVPTVFVEVTPEQATPDAPENTPNYSAQNSRAANPEPTKEAAVPKIDGSEERLQRTVEVLRPQPLAQPPSPPPDPRPEKPPAPATGELAVGSPPPEPAPRPRARTLVEARLQKGLVGPKSKQEGGVTRRGALSLDVKASRFGAYDQMLIEAIQQRWDDLLEERASSREGSLRTGRVVIEFTLHSDGRVTDATVKDKEASVSEIQAVYCRKAVTDPAPYTKWPEEMRKECGRDYREVRITFIYL